MHVDKITLYLSRGKIHSSCAAAASGDDVSIYRWQPCELRISIVPGPAWNSGRESERASLGKLKV
jgi:hypothetical protein